MLLQPTLHRGGVCLSQLLGDLREGGAGLAPVSSLAVNANESTVALRAEAALAPVLAHVAPGTGLAAMLQAAVGTDLGTGTFLAARHSKTVVAVLATAGITVVAGAGVNTDVLACAAGAAASTLTMTAESFHTTVLTVLAPEPVIAERAGGQSRVLSVTWATLHAQPTVFAHLRAAALGAPTRRAAVRANVWANAPVTSGPALVVLTERATTAVAALRPDSTVPLTHASPRTDKFRAVAFARLAGGRSESLLASRRRSHAALQPGPLNWIPTPALHSIRT